MSKSISNNSNSFQEKKSTSRFFRHLADKFIELTQEALQRCRKKRLRNVNVKVFKNKGLPLETSPEYKLPHQKEIYG